jgi:hypothetical protein
MNNVKPDLDFKRSSYCYGSSACAEVAWNPTSGSVTLRNSTTPDRTVRFSLAEWREFVRSLPEYHI